MWERCAEKQRAVLACTACCLWVEVRGRGLKALFKAPTPLVPYKCAELTVVAERPEAILGLVTCRISQRMQSASLLWSRSANVEDE